MRVLIPGLLLFASACAPHEVTVKGTVFETHDSETPFSGARIGIVDWEGAKYDNTRANDRGKFEATAPEGEYIHAEISGDGFLTTSFTGQSGFGEVFRVEDGTLYGVSTAEWAQWQARFANCPAAGAPGGVVFGEIRMLQLTSDDQHPAVVGIAEVITQNQKTIWDACYLDSDGVAYDPDAIRAGETGEFAIFGIDPGVHILTVGWEFAPEVWSFSDTYVRAIDGGVAPRFPAWVEWPEL